MKANAIHGLITGTLCGSYYMFCSRKPQSTGQRIGHAAIMVIIGLIAGAMIVVGINE